ncbi:MAG: hypothetical protein ACRD3K_14760 [Edaphobacter sp.]
MTLESGLTLGSWTLQEPDSSNKYHWLVICSCGNQQSVRSDSLKSGRSTGCGHNRPQALATRSTTHGQTNSRTYKTWVWMWGRVRHDARYKRVTICSRWKTFSKFLEDMGERPEGWKISLDRLDNTKGYSKENCQWSTPKAQVRNRGNSVRIPSSNHGSKSLEEWLEFIMERTSDVNWNSKKLKAVLTGFSIDQTLVGLGIDLNARCAIETAEPVLPFVEA